MSVHWLRLWHDMPNDPKWRTVSRISNQPISMVLSVYLHLLVEASRNVTRGHAAVTAEDLASALDADEEAIQSVLDAMQGRLLDQMYLLGWDKRQPKREDQGSDNGEVKSAAQRKAEQRAREKAAEKLILDAMVATQSHELSRNVTLDKDKDKDKEEKPNVAAATGGEDFVEKRVSKRQANDEDFKVARWLFDVQKVANPDSRDPNWVKWANDIRLMREVDGRSHRQICEMFKWAKNDSFWAPNIQSPSKLRDKWDTLTERRMKEAPPAPPKKRDWE